MVTGLQACRADLLYTLQMYGKNASGMELIDQDNTLGEVLRRSDHVMPGNPIFWIVCRGTVFEQKFLSSFRM